MSKYTMNKNYLDMSLGQIIDEIGISIDASDIQFFCNDIEVIKKFYKIVPRDVSLTEFDDPKKIAKVKEFFINHDNDIDKAKFILMSCYRIKENLNMVKSFVEEEKEKEKKKEVFTREKKEEDFITDKQRKFVSQTIEKKYNYTLSKIEEIGKNVNEIITEVVFVEKKSKYELNIIDSNAIIRNKKPTGRANERNIEKINEVFRENVGKDRRYGGLKLLLRKIYFSDVNILFGNKNSEDLLFGRNVCDVLGFNEIHENQEISFDDLEEARQEDKEELDEWCNKIDSEKLIVRLVDFIYKNIAYFNVEKLLVISAFRFQQTLETGKLGDEFLPTYKSVMERIYSVIVDMKCDKKEYVHTVQGNTVEENSEAPWLRIQYSPSDIKRCINKFTSKGFLTTEYINDIVEEIMNGEKTLPSLDEEEIDVIFSKSELEEIALLNDENFIYVSKKMNWGKEKIISKFVAMKSISGQLLETYLTEGILEGKDILDFYMKGLVSIEQINIISKIFDLSNDISEQKLYELYTKSHDENNKEKESTKKEYERYLELYRLIFKGLNEEKQNTYSDNLAGQIIEENEEKIANKYLKEFFINEVVTPDAIISWCSKEKFEELVSSCYESNSISLDKICRLTKEGKISNKIIIEIIYDYNTEYEQRMEILRQGFFNVNTISFLYGQNLLYKDGLKELAKSNIINENEMTKIIEEATLAKREENSKVVLKIRDDVRKKVYKMGGSSVESNNNSSKKKLIIKRKGREEYFKALGAAKPSKIIVSEESPFYNYEFYVIPNEEGDINTESIVIAERIYEKSPRNIEFPEDGTMPKLTYATGNATYCFKYGDLMVLSNYAKKDEVVNEIENTVFRATHKLSSGNSKRFMGEELFICTCTDNGFKKFKRLEK